MVRMTHWMGMLWLACASAGCAQFVDYVDSTCYQLKCEHRAKTAWMETRDLYSGVAYRYHFGEGFRAGYMGVCLGNDTGCSPAMPPRSYWSSAYLNCEGKAKTMAWFDGYAHGVLAASCSGCAGQCQIATASGGGGSGELGSALKGFKPPMRQDPYGRDYDPEPYSPLYDDPTTYDDPTRYDGPTPYVPRTGDLEPTPLELPIAPPGPADPSEDRVPGIDGPLAPEAPAAPALPLETWQDPEFPQPPSAKAFHIPVF